MTVSWELSAIRDLRELREYIAESDPGSAAVVVGRIQAAVQTLDQFPLAGRAGLVTGTRELAVARTPYVIVYRVEPHIVHIYRIRHGAQRWPPR